MAKLRPLDYELLFELMKNARRSDRELAKALGTSQPTVTRKRNFLEKELIDGYTAVPKWAKLGYEILAITFVKIKQSIASKEKYAPTRDKGLRWLMKNNSIIMAGTCRGMGVDSFMISLHRSYSDYDDFMRDYRLEMAEFMDDAQSILVNLRGREILKPLNFRYLAEAK
jgi:DNA-binding Lrp family transcriptional regulator